MDLTGAKHPVFELSGDLLPEPPTWIRQCIINSSLRSSQVPKSMKSAIVTPLLKKSTLDPDILKNYRPVSNLSYISKLLRGWWRGDSLTT